MKSAFAFLLFSLLISGYSSFGQDFTWWNEKVNWDGYTHWTKYLNMSPAYMGPNALPIPEVLAGNIGKGGEAEFGVEGHFSEGDNAQNLFTRIFIPTKANKAALEISIKPIEFYKMDTVTRDIRKARDYDCKGISSGDFYVGTYFQLLQDHKKLPDLLLSLHIKTASGTNVAATRNTDTPGYYFTLSAGKKYLLSDENDFFIYPFVLIGFYSWQINMDNNFQNDAPLYITGFDFAVNSFVIKNSFAGYRGYFDNGDRPSAYRLKISKKIGEHFVFITQYQKGFNDCIYNSIRFSLKYSFL